MMKSISPFGKKTEGAKMINAFVQTFYNHKYIVCYKMLNVGKLMALSLG